MLQGTVIRHSTGDRVHSGVHHSSAPTEMSDSLSNARPALSIGSPASSLGQFMWLWARLPHGCCFKGWLARGTKLGTLVAAVSKRPFEIVVQRQGVEAG
eukprot:SAG31_NODE_1405_length_8488_cov_2.786029_9_plen_99_part_00